MLPKLERKNCKASDLTRSFAIRGSKFDVVKKLDGNCRSFTSCRMATAKWHSGVIGEMGPCAGAGTFRTRASPHEMNKRTSCSVAPASEMPSSELHLTSGLQSLPLCDFPHPPPNLTSSFTPFHFPSSYQLRDSPHILSIIAQLTRRT
jgi:hypothetical protein